MTIDSLIPASLKLDFYTFYKVRILVTIILIYAMVFVAAIVWMYLAPTIAPEGRYAGNIICSLSLLGYVACLLNLHYRKAYRSTAHAAIAITSLSVAVGVFISGGPIQSPAITMSLLPSMMAFILLDKRGGLLWTCIIMTAHTLAVLAHISGVQFIQLLTPDMLALQHLAHCLLGYSAMVGLMYAVETLNMRLKQERDAEHSRFEHLASHDPLTNLANRLQFDKNITNAISRSQRNRKSFGLLMIDLDGFKPINDTLGHDAGDLVLQEISQRLRSTVRDIDTVARLGGDEFAIILEDLQTAENIIPVAEKLRLALEQPITSLAEQPVISASIGITVFPDHANDKKQLLKLADSAMYQAKKTKNAWHMHTPLQ